MVNNESLGAAGTSCVIRLLALIVQRGECSRFGSGMVTVDFLSWIVLDHFDNNTAPFPHVMKSPLARCLVMSNVANECGRILDNLRNEKKHVRYNAMKTLECGTVSQKASKECTLATSKVGRMVGSNGALSFNAFRYN